MGIFDKFRGKKSEPDDVVKDKGTSNKVININDASVSEIQDYLGNKINEIENISYKDSVPLLKGFSGARIFDTTKDEARFLSEIISMSDKEKIPNINIISTPDSIISSVINDVLLENGVSPSEIGYISPVMLESEGNEVLDNFFNKGEYKYLISDAYRLIFEGNINIEALKNKELFNNHQDKFDLNLFIIDPELMSTTQVNRTYNIMEGKENYLVEYFYLNKALFFSTENLIESKVLREKKGLDTAWDIDYVIENLYLSIKENDLNQLRKNLNMISYQNNPEAVKTLLESSDRIIEGIEKNQVNEKV